jgi:large subunit ribosomal protein L15
MMAPFRTRPLPAGPEFQVNADPRRLDDAYTRMLGPGGDKVLTDEVKWLAVTHKSFDHGKRGFNDRLAFLGMFCRGREMR